jgi:hypothetical protein
VKVGDAILSNIAKYLADAISICYRAILINLQKSRVRFLVPDLQPGICGKLGLGSERHYGGVDISAICQLYNN